jgi:type I restriction enzyme S subunit
MPNNWKTYKLSDALEIKYGKDHKKVQDGKIPIYGTGGIMRYGNQALYDKETILIPRKGSLNNIYYLNEPFWSVDTIFWSKINEEVAFPKYLFYNLKVLDFASMDVGSAIPSLTTELLKKIEIDLPSLPEQKSIAQILSTIDDKIENNLAINKTLEEMAMALYKHWFVDFGPFQDGEFVESELGLIPKGWEVKKIGDVIETLGGGTPSTTKNEYWENGEILWYSPTDLTRENSMYSFDSAKKINTLGLQKSSAKLFPANSLLMSSRATIGLLTINTKEACTNQGFITMLPNEKLTIYQLYFWTIQNMELIISKANGSTFKEISKSNFRDLDIIVANDIEKYIEESRDIFEQIKNNTLENQTLTQLRDTLLPKLISGEVRLKEFRE